MDFVEFYNKFAEEKNIEQISLSHLNKYGPNILLYQSGKNGVVMTMHATMVDPESKFSMLLYSASARLDQGVDKKDVGFSNRFLHYREFVEFKSLGYSDKLQVGEVTNMYVIAEKQMQADLILRP